VRPGNNRFTADSDIFGLRDAFFGFHGPPGRRSVAFSLTLTTAYYHNDDSHSADVSV